MPPSKGGTVEKDGLVCWIPTRTPVCVYLLLPQKKNGFPGQGRVVPIPWVRLGYDLPEVVQDILAFRNHPLGLPMGTVPYGDYEVSRRSATNQRPHVLVEGALQAAHLPMGHPSLAAGIHCSPLSLKIGYFSLKLWK